VLSSLADAGWIRAAVGSTNADIFVVMRLKTSRRETRVLSITSIRRVRVDRVNAPVFSLAFGRQDESARARPSRRSALARARVMHVT